MCGIWLLISQNAMTGKQYDSCQKLHPRGPNYCNTVNLYPSSDTDWYLNMSFHRLPIMDTSIMGRQPFKMNTGGRSIYMMCNGEIFNHKELEKEFVKKHSRTKFYSKSDCEILLYMYASYGFKKTMEMVKSNEFAMIVYEVDNHSGKHQVFAGRDPTGVRPLYWATNKKDNSFCLSSELKAVPDLDNVTCEQFKPGTFIHLEFGDYLENGEKDKDGQWKHLVSKDDITDTIARGYPIYQKYWDIDQWHVDSYALYCPGPVSYSLDKVREILTKAVTERLAADVEVGALLSGGLDSSLVCAIAAKYLAKFGKKLRTFSIGMPGGTDEKYAKWVSKYIGSTHVHYTCQPSEFEEAAENVIGLCESYDTTTVRATTGQYLICKKIRQDTNVKVLLVGDGSDELFGGYMYFHKAPGFKAFNDECIRLVKDIHLYDGLRGDRAIAGNGLEGRFPFLDCRLIKTVLETHPLYRKPRTEGEVKAPIEKWLLRKAFEGYLPKECLWRRKEAFSDGVSGMEDPWYVRKQKYCNKLYTPEEFKEKAAKYTHYTPVNTEELYNRELFAKLYSENVTNVIPYRWVPKWVGNVLEPSARVLNCYQKDTVEKSTNEK